MSYIEPQFQLPERALSRQTLDWEGFKGEIVLALTALGKALAEVFSAIVTPIVKLVQGICDAGLPKRRRKRYIKVPFKARKINRRLRAQLCYTAH